jgi:hypothetical protein
LGPGVQHGINTLDAEKLTINVASAPAISSSVIRCAGSLAISALTTATTFISHISATEEQGRLTDQAEQVPPAALSVCSKSIVGPLFPLDELRSFGAGEALREVLDVIHSALDVF